MALSTEVTLAGQKSIPAIAQKYAVDTGADASLNPTTATDDAKDNLGTASITMFVAFLLSSLASILGAFLAKIQPSPIPDE